MDKTIEKLTTSVGPFTIDLVISISDIVSIITLITIIFGGIFALYKWNRNTKLKRSEYINELTNKIRTDEYIKDIVLVFDYGKPWYSKEFHGSGEIEEKVDKTLSYFSYICLLQKEKIISKKEFKFFEYEIERILQNGQVRDYLFNLYHFAKKFDVPFTFYYLFEYGEKKKMFNSDFYDRNAYNNPRLGFHNYLNF